jgi:hypothetical protein
MLPAMASVFFSQPFRQFTGGIERLDISARDYRELVARIAERFPELRQVLAEEVSVAIDGEIIHEPFLETIGPRSEIHFLTRISGG